MKVQLSQINTTPRDFKGNVSKILEGIDLANQRRCELVVFPELSIPGYLSQDLMYTKRYVSENLRHLHDIVAYSKGKKPHIILGYIGINNKGVGKPFTNMTAVIHNGVITATYQKQLLPFYDVFDEGRYFEPGNSPTVVTIGNRKWAILCCEDAWNDKGSDDYNYTNNPLEIYRKLGITNFISVNSSPFVCGKPERRTKMLSKSLDPGGIFIYVNQVGGQDELFFDGHSFVLQAREDRITYCHACPTKETHDLVELKDTDTATLDFSEESRSTQFHGLLRDDSKHLFEALVLSLRDYIHKTGFKQVVLGSSGGIDSAVVACLACEAISPENVHCIRMPSIYSSDHSKADAKQLHINLGCHDYEFPISHMEIVDRIKGCLTCNGSKYDAIADENIQARLRGLTLMHFSNAYGALLLTTGNKTELALGYYTLYGDSCGGFGVIKDLYKLQVYELARYINKTRKNVIPNNIIAKAPSAELAPGQEDEKALLPYAILDPIVQCYIEDYIDSFEDFNELQQRRMSKIDSITLKLNTSLSMLNEWLKSPKAEENYYRMIAKIDRNEFKRRQSAPGTKVSKVSFGTGRRLPIAKG
jgi:NAD+ synthase (glutamine-hydrolysing)